MSTALASLPKHTLNNPSFLKRVNALRTLDNATNWYYLAREYLYLGLVVGLALTFFISREGWGLPWAWNIPVSLLAIVLIGAGQHRLTTLGHEASHYMLFRNRRLNELISDYFCMFPVWSTTHFYRLQHLAHHQFPNDPERDPDVAQMEASGHRFAFPMSPGRFVWECVIKQILWLPGLIRYVRMRAKYAATGGGKGPYWVSKSRSKLLILVGALYLLSIFTTTTALAFWGNPLLLTLIPIGQWVAVCLFFGLVPSWYFMKTMVKPEIPPRWTTLGRVSFLTVTAMTLGWLTYGTGKPWLVYYTVLWLVPLATMFSFFMLLRQIVQHGNADQERFGNTRIFLISRLIRFAVFPLGMDYHLPHHLFPLTPHYRLPELHELLLENEEYREKGTIAEGYFFHRDPPQHPTVLELMAK
jgi:fatty acid desaturase